MSFEKLPDEIVMEILDKLTYDDVLDIYKKKVDKRITDIAAKILRRRNQKYSRIPRQILATKVLLEKFNAREAERIIGLMMERFSAPRNFDTLRESSSSAFAFVYLILSKKLPSEDPLLPELKKNRSYVELAFLIIRFDFLAHLLDARYFQHYMDHFISGHRFKFTNPKNEELADVVDGDKLWKKMLVPYQHMPFGRVNWFLTPV